MTVRSDERTIRSVGLTLDVTLASFIRLNGRSIEEPTFRRPILVGLSARSRPVAWYWSARGAGFVRPLALVGYRETTTKKNHTMAEVEIAGHMSVAESLCPLWRVYSGDGPHCT